MKKDSKKFCCSRIFLFLNWSIKRGEHTLPPPLKNVFGHSNFGLALAKKEECKCPLFRRMEQASFWNNDSDHSNSPMISWCNTFGARLHAVYSWKFVCIRKINLYMLSKNLSEVIFVLKSCEDRLDCQGNHNGLICG